MSYTIEITGLDKMREYFKKSPQIVGPILEKATKKAGAMIVKTEKEQAPVKTATLRRSVELEYRPIQIRVYPNSRYAEYVEYGTGLFGPNKTYITPKRAKAMVFQGKNGLVFTRRSKGQAPNPFVERTVEMTRDNVDLIFRSALVEIINTY